MALIQNIDFELVENPGGMECRGYLARSSLGLRRASVCGEYATYNVHFGSTSPGPFCVDCLTYLGWEQPCRLS